MIVPRSVDVLACSSHSVNRIGEAFGAADYWHSRLTLYEAGTPALDTLTIDPDGTISVRITMRFGGDQLPPVMRPLRLGSIRVLHCERWWPEADTLRGEVTVAALRTPISGRGDVQIAARESDTCLRGTASAEVKIPFIGGPIAAFFTGQIATGVREIVKFTDDWLDASHQPSD